MNFTNCTVWNDPSCKETTEPDDGFSFYVLIPILLILLAGGVCILYRLKQHYDHRPRRIPNVDRSHEGFISPFSIDKGDEEEDSFNKKERPSSLEMTNAETVVHLPLLPMNETVAVAADVDLDLEDVELYGNGTGSE